MQFDLQVGVGTLVVAKPLDAEVQSVYNMTIQVTDGTNFATAQVQTLDLLCTGTASCTLQIHIKLNYCYLFLGEVFTLSFPPSYACTLFFWKLSLADYEMCFLFLCL